MVKSLGRATQQDEDGEVNNRNPQNDDDGGFLLQIDGDDGNFRTIEEGVWFFRSVLCTVCVATTMARR